MTHVLGIAGFSGSGKTTLVTALLPRLTARGVSVSTVKHAHHSFEIDRPGKDSHRHRQAGAREVLVSGRARWALIHENHGEAEASLAVLLAVMAPVDLILVEGFKHGDHEKIEVIRAEGPSDRLYPDDRRVIAIAADHPVTDASCPVLPLAEPDAVSAFIVRHFGLA